MKILMKNFLQNKLRTMVKMGLHPSEEVSWLSKRQASFSVCFCFYFYFRHTTMLIDRPNEQKDLLGII